VRFHASSWERTALAREGYGWWTHWREWVGLDAAAAAPSIRRTGTLVLDTGDGYVDRAVSHLERLGIPYERWDVGETRRRWPYLDLHRYGTDLIEPSGWLDGALYTPESGYVDDPALAVENLVDACRQAGGQMRWGAMVTGVRPLGSGRLGVVLDSGETMAATSVLCAAGPQSRRLLEACGVLSDFTVLPAPLRHDMFLAPVGAEVLGDARLTHLVDRDLGTNFRPEGDQALLGGSEEPAGTVGDPAQSGWPSEERPDPALHDEVLLRLSRRIPGLGVPLRPRGTVGYYDVTDDWMPIYDRTCVPGLFVMAGTSGNQLKTAPVVGQLMAELMTACADGHDHDSDPLTVPGRYVDCSFSLAPFSRRRRPAPVSARTING
jgi:sarcosine oxidase subunit beta